MLNPVFTFNGNVYLGISVELQSKTFYSINIYSSCSLAEKRVLLEELMNWKNRMVTGEWVLDGDFNAVKELDERSDN